MGEYIKQISNKTDIELKVIFDSITTYNGEFIEDFLTELDKRKMLWEMKVTLNNTDLITLVIKLETITNSKYLNILRRELEIRDLVETYEQRKDSTKNKDQTQKKANSNTGVYGGVFSVLILIFVVYKNYFQDKTLNNNRDFPTINKPEFNHKLNVPNYAPNKGYDYTPSSSDWNIKVTGDEKITNNLDYYKQALKYQETDLTLRDSIFKTSKGNHKFNLDENLTVHKMDSLPAYLENLDYSISPNYYNQNLKLPASGLIPRKHEGEEKLNPAFQRMLDTIGN